MASCDTNRCKVVFSLIFVFVECLCFAVTFVGWPNLVEIFKRENLFSELCDTAPVNTSYVSDNVSTSAGGEAFSHGCKEGDKMYSLCFSIAAVVFALSSFPVGLLFDKYGLRVTRTSGTLFYLVGILLLAFTTSGDPSYMIFPGLTMISVGGMHLMVTAPHLSLQAGNKTSTIATLNSGAMDSGVIVLLCVKLAYDYGGIGHRASLLFLAGLWVIVLFNTFVLSPKFKVQISEKHGESNATASTSDTKDPSNQQETLSSMTFKECLISPLWLLMVLWFSISHLRFMYTIGSLNSWLLDSTDGDENKVSHYVNVFSYIAFGGILVAPISGTVTDFSLMKGLGTKTEDPILSKAKALTPSLWIGTVLSLLHSLITIFPNETTIYMSFVLLTLQRAFIYGNMFSYMAIVFPMHLFGKCFGLGFFTGGVLSCLQYALFIWAEEKDSFQNVHILLLVLMMSTMLLPIYIEVAYKCNIAKTYTNQK